jgi:hypothetical protein
MITLLLWLIVQSLTANLFFLQEIIHSNLCVPCKQKLSAAANNITLLTPSSDVIEEPVVGKVEAKPCVSLQVAKVGQPEEKFQTNWVQAAKVED